MTDLPASATNQSRTTITLQICLSKSVIQIGGYRPHNLLKTISEEDNKY
jgi:hypothetical protein